MYNRDTLIANKHELEAKIAKAKLLLVTWDRETAEGTEYHTEAEIAHQEQYLAHLNLRLSRVVAALGTHERQQPSQPRKKRVDYFRKAARITLDPNTFQRLCDLAEDLEYDDRDQDHRLHRAESVYA